MCVISAVPEQQFPLTWCLPLHELLGAIREAVPMTVQLFYMV